MKKNIALIAMLLLAPQHSKIIGADHTKKSFENPGIVSLAYRFYGPDSKHNTDLHYYVSNFFNFDKERDARGNRRDEAIRSLAEPKFYRPLTNPHDINRKDASGDTALHHLATTALFFKDLGSSKDKLEFVSKNKANAYGLLLELRADPNILSDTPPQLTPLQTSLFRQIHHDDYYPGHPARIARLHKQHKIPFSEMDRQLAAQHPEAQSFEIIMDQQMLHALAKPNSELEQAVQVSSLKKLTLEYAGLQL
jgi:hypothetical protein